MKKYFVSFLFILNINLLYTQEIWTITSLDWQPYSGSELLYQGKSIQKLRELLAGEDIDLLVEFYPWLRSQFIVRNDPGYLGYFPAWPQEVTDGFIMSLPVDWSEIAVMTQSDQVVVYQNIDEMFRKYKVGIVRTYTYPDIIEKSMNKYPDNVFEIDNETSLLKMLSINRFDIALTDPNVISYLASKAGITNIEYVKTIMNIELVIAVLDNDENRQKLEIINRLLKESLNRN